MKKRISLHKRAAFTLLEMVIALSVFMILMGGVFQAVLFAMRAQESVKLERSALLQTRLWSQDFQNSLRGASWPVQEETGDLLSEYREDLAENLEELSSLNASSHELQWVDAQAHVQRLRWDPETQALFWNESPLYDESIQVSSFRYESYGSLLKWDIKLEAQDRVLLEYQNAQNL